jgi:hypothetical protein
LTAFLLYLLYFLMHVLILIVGTWWACTASFKHKIRGSLMSFNSIDLKSKYPPLNFAAATAVMLAALEAALEGGGVGGVGGHNLEIEDSQTACI